MQIRTDIGIPHKGLRYELCSKKVMQCGIFADIFALLTVISVAFDKNLGEKSLSDLVFSWTGLGALSALVTLGFAIYYAMGFTYKRGLAAYISADMTGGEAEKDFAKGIMVTVNDNIICMGEKRLFYMDFYGNAHAFDYKSIVWTFVIETGVKVKGGAEAGTKLAKIQLCFRDMTMPMICPEEKADGIVETIRTKSRCAAGWSEALWELYSKEPEKFHIKRLELPAPDEKARCEALKK